MKVYMITKDSTDYSRIVEEWLRDFSRQTGKTIEIVDPDSLDGSEFCRAYDIVEYPTIIAVDDGGSMQNTWRGTMLPTIGEVSYYA